MMNSKQLTLVLDGEAWIEYAGRLYEHCAQEPDGRHIFSDVNDGYAIWVTEKALRQSTEFFYTEKY